MSAGRLICFCSQSFGALGLRALISLRNQYPYSISSIKVSDISSPVYEPPESLKVLRLILDISSSNCSEFRLIIFTSSIDARLAAAAAAILASSSSRAFSSSI